MPLINNVPAWTGTVTTCDTLQRRCAQIFVSQATLRIQRHRPPPPLPPNTYICIIHRVFQFAVVTGQCSYMCPFLFLIGYQLKRFRATSPQPLYFSGLLQPQHLGVSDPSRPLPRALGPLFGEDAVQLTCPASCGLQGSWHLWSPWLCRSMSSRVM